MLGRMDLAMLLDRPADLPPLVGALSLAWAFLVAACWGSFLNVVIARVPKGESVVHPRSRCPKCQKPIAGYDNIPVFSWLLLRGKCRSCRAPIAWRYPFVELLVGIAGMAVVARAGYSLESLELFVFICILTAIAFVDLDTWTIPKPLYLALIVSGAAFAGVHALVEHDAQVLVPRAIGAVGAGVAMAAVVVVATGVARRTGKIGPDDTAMGWGDPLILVGVGAYLGWRSLPLVLFLASLQGSVFGIIAVLSGKYQGDAPVSDDDDWVPPKHAVPFGPFLALGALEAAFFGDAVMARVQPLFGALLGADPG